MRASSSQSSWISNRAASSRGKPSKLTQDLNCLECVHEIS